MFTWLIRWRLACALFSSFLKECFQPPETDLSQCSSIGLPGRNEFFDVLQKVCSQPKNTLRVTFANREQNLSPILRGRLQIHITGVKGNNQQHFSKCGLVEPRVCNRFNKSFLKNQNRLKMFPKTQGWTGDLLVQRASHESVDDQTYVGIRGYEHNINYKFPYRSRAFNEN